ncbi:hypothetical protein [Litoreibacter arenae]|uniref:Uncharacterized protein n=1 Tax=Litoreibacter arenae DSM 19593 TaxID=1123360 RepID=S9QIF0_9RHOB|nr:hypothetical protein [Litoreibacter arenae]EPX81236.1 hypothetical protein thalar_00686 [Litoreibacter arenae DSM 19593]
MIDHSSSLPLLLILSVIGGAVAASVCMIFGAGWLLAFGAYSLGGALIFVITGLLVSRTKNR